MPCSGGHTSETTLLQKRAPTPDGPCDIPGRRVLWDTCKTLWLVHGRGRADGVLPNSGRRDCDTMSILRK